ncbi:hypothetical protein [Kaistella sp.]|uniref:hypothetical protein n=1 Tax=Kaistella sp. TaxID=2782235 RepID=UPI003C514068
MKNLFFLTLVMFFAFLSCRSGEESVQKIDQVIKLYIDSAGQDMLNAKLSGSYVFTSMNDVYGLTDNAPVSVSIKKNSDTINYIEYLAGAKRIGIDSSGSMKIYESKIALRLTKKIHDSNRVTNDTMTIQYQSTPNLFQVAKIWYNGTLQFTKVEGQSNTVKIVK